MAAPGWEHFCKKSSQPTETGNQHSLLEGRWHLGISVAPSPHGVGETIDRLLASLGRRHIEVFARIHRGGAARAVGLELGAEEVVIFGDPRIGTALMRADRRIGLELPPE